jgi:hypothetical protein
MRSGSVARAVGAASGMFAGLAEKLPQVGDHVGPVLGRADAAEVHPRAGDERARILDIGVERLGRPDDAVRARALQTRRIARVVVEAREPAPEEPLRCGPTRCSAPCPTWWQNWHWA